MARKSGEDVAKVSKRGTASGKKPKAKAAGMAIAQRRKDPVFMKNLESAIIEERARVDADAKVAALAAAKAAPSPGPKAKAAPSTAPKAKAAANSSRKAGKPDRKALADELSGLIPGLDSEGLAFLIEQARVHLYNMRVVELEDAAVEAERASKRAHSIGSAGDARRKPAGSSDDFQIHAAENGSSYDLVWHDKWKMFTDEEMLAMVRIASSKDAVADVGGRLYRWLLAERRDVLADIPFSGLADPKLKKLVALLRRTFTVRGKK